MVSLSRILLFIVASIVVPPGITHAQTPDSGSYKSYEAKALPVPDTLTVEAFKALPEENQFSLLHQKLTALRRNLASPIFANGLTKPLDVARSHISLILTIDTKLYLTNPADNPDQYRAFAELISQLEEDRPFSEAFEETLRDLVANHWR